MDDVHALRVLLGSPRVAPRHLDICVYHGHCNKQDRFDIESNKVINISCGNDFMFIEKQSLGKICLIGLGANWKREISRDSELSHFSKEVPILEKTTAFCCSPADSFLALENNIVVNNLGTMRLQLPRKVIRIAAGTSHVLILCEDRSVYGVGSNSNGQLGLFIPDKNKLVQNAGDESDKLHHEPLFLQHDIDSVVAAYDQSYFIVGSRVYSPCNSENHIFSRSVLKVVCGRHHSLALVEGDEVNQLYGWGDNARGAVGVSSCLKPRGAKLSKPQLINSRLSSFQHKVDKIIQIAAGEYFSIVALDDGTAFMWGSINRKEMILGPKLMSGLKHVEGLYAGPSYAVFVHDSRKQALLKIRKR